jgi:hypothetical protein
MYEVLCPTSFQHTYSSLQCTGSYCYYFQHVTSFCSVFCRTRRDMTRICWSKYFVPRLSLQCAAHNTAIHYIDRRHLSPSLWILILTSGGIAGFFPISGQTLGVCRDLPSLYSILGYLKGSGSTLIVKTWGFHRGQYSLGSILYVAFCSNGKNCRLWRNVRSFFRSINNFHYH